MYVGASDAGASTCNLLPGWHCSRPDSQHLLQSHQTRGGFRGLGGSDQDLDGWGRACCTVRFCICGQPACLLQYQLCTLREEAKVWKGKLSCSKWGSVHQSINACVLSVFRTHHPNQHTLSWKGKDVRKQIVAMCLSCASLFIGCVSSFGQLKPP